MSKAEMKKQIELLVKKLAKLKSKKQGSTPEAKSIRKELRDLGHYVSKNDVREGKPRKKSAIKSKTKKPKKKLEKRNKIQEADDEEDG